MFFVHLFPKIKIGIQMALSSQGCQYNRHKTKSKLVTVKVKSRPWDLEAVLGLGTTVGVESAPSRLL